MATKDITRFLLQPVKQYRSVRVQQGRPLLDSDYNEGTRIREEDRRRLLLDAFGRVASPDEGFTLGPPGLDQPLSPGVLRVEQVLINGVPVGVYPVNIRPGSVYVGGMRFELGQLEHIALQRDYLQLKAGTGPGQLRPVNPMVFSPLAIRPLPPRPVSPPRVTSPPVSPLVAVSPPSSPPPASPPAAASPVTLSALPRGQVASIALRDVSAVQLPRIQVAQALTRLVSSPRPNVPQFPPFRYLYYLNCWEQTITPAEDDELLEKGLAGPDTSVRIKRMRRVEVLPLGPGENCTAALLRLAGVLERTTSILDRQTFELRSRGRLRLVFQQPAVNTACPPCTPDPGARYLGTENQTLRIMQSSDVPTDGLNRFVWTNDNSAPLYRVSVKVEGKTSDKTEQMVVTMFTLPRDAEHTPAPGQIVEIIPFAAILEGAETVRSSDPHYQRIADEVGAFVRIDKVEEGRLFLDMSDRSRIAKIESFVTSWDPRHPAAIADRHVPRALGERFFFMRVWHDAGTTSVVELPLNTSPSGPPLGKTGVIPIFHSAGRRGDYWTATFRVDARDRVVPLDLMSNPNGVPPHGPRHFYAPLAILNGNNQQVTAIEACSEQGRRLTDHGCASRTVGDGITSFGDFDTIQEAIDSLPLEGGLIEVRPGLYDDNVDIQNRNNITIRGCGPNTVIQSPDSGTGNLVNISQSSEVTLANVQVNVADQVGINISQAGSVTLSDVSIAAGTVSDEDFTPNAGTFNQRLVQIQSATGVSFQRGLIDSWRRSALLATSSQGVEIGSLEVSGSVNVPSIAQFPLFDFSSVSDLRMHDCVIETFGQECVQVVAADFELKSLTLTTSEAINGAFEPPRSALAVLSSTRGRIEQCRITMSADDNSEEAEHAAVVLDGTDLIFEDNDVETLASDDGALAWGGIQVRGGSVRIELRRNRIKGGLGHGITLGSVTSGSQIQPAGFRQISSTTPPHVTGSIDGGGTDPVIGETIQHLLIADNRIENMGTNGISVLVMLGVGEAPADRLVEVRHAVIVRNQIQNNLLQLSDEHNANGASSPMSETLPFGPAATSPTSPTEEAFVHFATKLAMNRLPYAGIVLSLASGSLEIRGNVITDNAALGAGLNGGIEQRLPINGVFVLVGDGIVIADNRIANNGARRNFEETQSVLSGVRAGIAVMLAGPGEVTTVSGLRERVGIAEDTTPAFAVNGAGTATRIENNSVQQPEGRALHLVGAGPISIDGNFFSSLGNHGARNEEGRYQIGDVVFVENLGAPWETRGFASLNLAAFHKAGTEMDAYLNNTATPRLFLALGGALSFQNNQVVSDWEVIRVDDLDQVDPFSFFSVALLAVDHVSCNGNQFAQHLVYFGPGAALSPDAFPIIDSNENDIDEDAPLLCQVYITAASAQVVRNRFSADQRSVLFSLCLHAELMGTVAHNQGTYQMLLGAMNEAAPHPDLINEGNQFLYIRDDFPQDLNFLIDNLRPYRDILLEKPDD